MLSHFLASPNFELAFCIPNKLNETDKNSIINFINSNDKEEVYSPVYPRQFLNQVCNKYNIFDITYHHEENNPFIDGVKGVILRYLLINEIHTMLFDDGDSRKIEVLVQRNDYKSKLLNKFLTYFEWIIIYFEQRQVFVQEELLKIFLAPIREQINIIRNKIIMEKFKGIKGKIDQITGGLSDDFYYRLLKNPDHFIGNIDPYYLIDSELNNYIIDQFHYDFVKLNDYFRYRIIANMKDIFNVNDIFQKIILNEDGSFPFFESHTILNFINAVYNYNKKSGEKLVNYIFTQLTKSKEGQFVVNNSLPLIFISEITLKKVASMLKHRLIDRYTDRNVEIKEDLLIYPINCNIEESKNYISYGKQIFSSFISDFYEPKGAEQFWAIFNSPDSIIREKRIVPELDREYLETFSKNYYYMVYLEKEEQLSLEKYEKEYNTTENILNRFYIDIAMAEQVFHKEVNKIIFDNLHDLFMALESTYHLKNKQQMSTQSYDDQLHLLKASLERYGIIIKNPKNYVISLMDLKVATKEENMMFPILEQLGDAIYEMEIMKFLFRDLEIEDSQKLTEEKIKYVNAIEQVKVAKHLGLDKMFITHPYQFQADKKKIDKFDDNYIFIEKNMEDKERYLADSFEMIIGSIYLEYGLTEAFNFVDKVLIDFYPALRNLSSLDLGFSFDDDRETIEKKVILNERFKPTSHLLSEYYDPYKSIYHTLGSTLVKLLKLYVLGNETIKKRKYINKDSLFHEINIYKNNAIINSINICEWVAYYYLYDGLFNTFNKFKPLIQDEFDRVHSL